MLPDADDSASKDLLVTSGRAERPISSEQLHDLILDRNEAADVADDPAYAGVLAVRRERPECWMAETDDPLLDGPVPPPPGTAHDHPAERSADDRVCIVPGV